MASSENFDGHAAQAIQMRLGWRRLLETYPQGRRARFLRPAEVADLIFYLAQPSAAGITGANLSIDFGLSAGI